MDLHRLGLVSTRVHYFQLVARHGSIRQTARQLNIAPSSVSRVLKQLEDDLGAPLFQRVNQRLKLTSAGELLLYRARTSFSELTRAHTEIDDLQGLRRGTVAIAVIESVARGLLPAVLEEFWQRYPSITVDTAIVTSQQAFAAVADAECDLAVAFDGRMPRKARRMAGVNLELGAVVPPDHPFAGFTELRISDLAGEDLVMSDSTLSLGPSIEEAIGSFSLDLRRRSRTNSIGLMVDLARRRLAVALQTRVGVEQEIADGSLVFVPLRDPKIKPRKLVLISRGQGDVSEAAAVLARQLVGALEGLQ